MLVFQPTNARPQLERSHAATYLVGLARAQLGAACQQARRSRPVDCQAQSEPGVLSRKCQELAQANLTLGPRRLSALSYAKTTRPPCQAVYVDCQKPVECLFVAVSPPLALPTPPINKLRSLQQRSFGRNNNACQQAPL